MGKSHSGETCFLPGGKPGALFEANIEGWLLRMEEENPALFSYFLAREEGRRPLVAWYGEFPGKFLTAVAECYAMTGDRRLLPVGGRIAEMLRKVQDADGYLGPYRRDQRMVGFTLDHPNEWPLWDIWGHYHCIYGLCLWYEAVGDPHDLQTARRAADYVIGYFAQPGRRYVDAGAPDQNLAIAHGYLKLYTVRKPTASSTRSGRTSPSGTGGAPPCRGRNSTRCTNPAGKACTASWLWANGAGLPAMQRTGWPLPASGNQSAGPTATMTAAFPPEKAPAEIPTTRGRWRPAAPFSGWSTRRSTSA